MKLKRVIDMPTLVESKRVYARFKKGTMTYYEDGEGYACYDEDELINYKPPRAGRKSLLSKTSKQNQTKK